jgi:hypothetical protein
VKKRLLIPALAVAALVVAAVASRGPVLRWVGRRALVHAATKLGVEIRVDRLLPDGLTGLRLEGVRVGPDSDPLVTAAAVQASVDASALLHGHLAPHAIDLEGPEIAITGDGTLQGALRALADRARSVRGNAGASSGEGAAAPLPAVHLSGGRLVDRAGALRADDAELLLGSDGRLIGHVRAAVPDLGTCRLEGRLEGRRPVQLDVRCEKPYRVGAAGLGHVDAGAFGVAQGADGRWLELRGARLGRGEGDRLPAMFDGATLDARVRLDATDTRPVEVSLTLPGGAKLRAAGALTDAELTVRADLDGVALPDVNAMLGGTVSGHVEARYARAEGHATVDADVTLTGLRLTHPALGENPVGPADVGFSGRLDVETKPVRHVTLSDGRGRLGNVAANLEGELVFNGERPHVRGRFSLGPVRGEDLTAAVPPGLMPDLQGLELTGPFGLRIVADVDPDKPEDAQLDIDVDTAGLRVVRLPPQLRFGQLRDRFETHFEMPDGRIITRVTGPRSDRWTPLGAVPPLLPTALLASEDGGFYGHHGVSLKHLRESLIRDLQAGRFAYGGSTLTMQLSRNLFLNRHKTLTRKLEEVVVSWLLEGAFTKSELLTLYLNVVEFGPEVFGIGDAARHYFGKDPAQLTPIEIVFLVKILPGPRTYHYMFERKHLAEYYRSWMQQLLDLLLERGQLTPEEHAAADPLKLWGDQAGGTDDAPAPPPDSE